jgi:hypothetical protein
MKQILTSNLCTGEPLVLNSGNPPLFSGTVYYMNFLPLSFFRLVGKMTGY